MNNPKFNGLYNNDDQLISDGFASAKSLRGWREHEGETGTFTAQVTPVRNVTGLPSFI